MASPEAQKRYAFVLSVLGHAAIVVALTFSIPLSRSVNPVGAPNVVPIDSFLIDEAAIEQEIARIEAAEEAERVRQREEAERVEREEAERQERLRQEQEELARVQRERELAEQAAERERIRIQQEADAERERLARIEEERLEAERRAEEERLERERQEEERRRQEELARQREEEERRRREAEEAARRAAIQEEIDRAIAAERAAREAADAGLRDQWARAIGDRVGLYWTRPPNVGTDLECVLLVEQLPNGEVVDVTVETCNTSDGNIIRSVENAVLNASPLPPPPRGVAFERVVRITFRPDE